MPRGLSYDEWVPIFEQYERWKKRETERLTNSIPDPLHIVRIAALECQVADLWERLRILEALHDQARQPLKRELGL